MKKILTGCVALFALFGIANQASADVIYDRYWGSDGHGYGDRIGSYRYEVRNMNVTFSGGFMNVRVNTHFDASRDRYGIDYGDLFISTDGWNPYGSSSNRYRYDNAANGEDWEFVFDTSEGMLYGGDFGISLSDDLMTSGVYRNGQEVQRSGGGNALAGSSVDLSNVGYRGWVSYSIDLASLGITGPSEIGLKWGMTCANDTIEGAVHTNVPEPSTLMLLSLGLLGLGFARRKKRV